MMGRRIVVTGGARSGKSRFATEIAGRLGQRVAYVATARVDDDEMNDRVQKHRRNRPATWLTIEEPTDLAGVLVSATKDADVILVDCATLWVTNLMLDGETIQGEPSAEWMSRQEGKIMATVQEFCSKTSDLAPHVVIVTNETGQGVVPAFGLGRLFRDVSGRVNHLLAEWADEAYLVVAGQPLPLKELAAQVWSRFPGGAS